MGRSIIARAAVAFLVLKSLLIKSGRCKKKMGLSGAALRMDQLGSVGGLSSKVVLRLVSQM
jgi:hypothetical protein